MRERNREWPLYSVKNERVRERNEEWPLYSVKNEKLRVASV